MTIDTNPKDALGVRKPPLSTIPAGPLFDLGAVMLHGALKYGRHNWRVCGVRASIYYDAAQRHLCSWWEGEDNDPESGLPHLAHAMACLVIVRDAQRARKLDDDRPPASDPVTEDLRGIVATLLADYPSPPAAATQVDALAREWGAAIAQEGDLD